MLIKVRGILSGFKGIFLIALGILAEAFGLKSFLIPNGVIEGGITGISLLISFITPLSISFVIFFLNLPFIFLAKKQLGKEFAVKAFVTILLLSAALIFVEFPSITDDKLLATVFGGFLVGAGTGLAIRGSSVLDGSEILSIYLNRKFGLSIGEVVMIINTIIFSVAAMILGIEAALYSILTYLVGTKTIDFFIQGFEEYISLTIISKESKKVREILVNELGKGVTIYKGKSGFNTEKDTDIDIIYTFITRLEVVKIKNRILDIDPKAVIIEQGINEIHGGLIKKRPLHKEKNSS
jgi:uncharacterized membrane-anchored protein YitT (DUF2179 family)